MNKQELINILSDNTKNDWLFREADKIRHKNVGDEIHLRALIEFSNICKRQCFYCGLRSPNKEVERGFLLFLLPFYTNLKKEDSNFGSESEGGKQDS